MVKRGLGGEHSLWLYTFASEIQIVETTLSWWQMWQGIVWMQKRRLWCCEHICRHDPERLFVFLWISTMSFLENFNIFGLQRLIKCNPMNIYLLNGAHLLIYWEGCLSEIPHATRAVALGLGRAKQSRRSLESPAIFLPSISDCHYIALKLRQDTSP